jgi:hypothetical protein
MQVLKLPAIAGLIWVSAGFRLLFRQSLRMFSLIVMYLFGLLFVASFATLIANLLRPYGVEDELVLRVVVFCAGIFGPVLLMGYMAACRDVMRGERISPLYILRGFQLPRATFLSLLVLGLIQVTTLNVLLSLLPVQPITDLNVIAAGQAQRELTPSEAVIQLAVLIAMMLTLVTLWYAPMLAAWHDMRVGKSMFFSIAACWRNKGAFFMFGIGWMIAISFCVMALSMIAVLLGKNDLTYALVAVIMMLMTGAGYCSVYVTYSTVFVSDTDRPAP